MLLTPLTVGKLTEVIPGLFQNIVGIVRPSTLIIGNQVLHW